MGHQHRLSTEVICIVSNSITYHTANQFLQHIQYQWHTKLHFIYLCYADISSVSECSIYLQTSHPIDAADLRPNNRERAKMSNRRVINVGRENDEWGQGK